MDLLIHERARQHAFKVICECPIPPHVPPKLGASETKETRLRPSLDISVRSNDGFPPHCVGAVLGYAS